MAHQHLDGFTINLTFTEQFFSCHQAQNLPGKQRLTGDQRWLGAWHRFCMLSRLNWNLTEGINSCFCPVMLLFATLRKRECVRAGFTNFVFCVTKESRHISRACMQTSIIVCKCQIIMTMKSRNLPEPRVTPPDGLFLSNSPKTQKKNRTFSHR